MEKMQQKQRRLVVSFTVGWTQEKKEQFITDASSEVHNLDVVRGACVFFFFCFYLKALYVSRHATYSFTRA